MMLSTRILIVAWVAAAWLLVPAALARADDSPPTREPIIFVWAQSTTPDRHHHRHGCPLNPACFGLDR